MAEVYEITRAQVEAISNRVSNSLVFIRLDHEGAGHSVGTGILVTYRGKLYVLTAHHVVRDAEEGHAKVSFHVRPNGPMQFVDPADLKTQPASRPDPMATLIGVEAIPITDEGHDLAAFPVSTTQLPPPLEPFDIEKNCVESISEGASLITVGLPFDGGFTDAMGRQVLLPWHDLVQYRADIDKSGLPTVSWDDYFVYPFTLHLDGIKPHGFSGAPIWANANTESEIWAPVPKIVGFAQQYFAGSKLILAIKPKHILTLLARC